MFLKTIFSFILSHILLFTGVNTKIDITPTVATSTIPATTTPVSIEHTNLPMIDTKPVDTPVTKNIDSQKDISPKISAPTKKIPSQTIPLAKKDPEPVPDFEVINQFARKAIVNILCTTKGGELNPISGTGVIVEPNGLILTNAHIGQYLLLKDFRQKDFIQCVARTGSPAYPKYNLELVYISPTWVENNKAQLKDQNPKGTGEDDFAFLRITKMIDGSNLPDKFPFVTMNIRENIETGEPVLLVSYPAGFLGGLSILQNLNVTSAVTNIQDVYTFKDGTIDIVAVGGTVVSQKGSSGGLVVDKYSTLIGVISTSSDGDTTKDRGLNAITLGYINRDMQKEIDFGLKDFLSQSPKTFAEIFASTTAPSLTKLITDELIKQ